MGRSTRAALLIFGLALTGGIVGCSKAKVAPQVSDEPLPDGAVLRMITRRPDGTSDFVNAMAVSADNQVLAAGYIDGTIRLWDLAAGRQLRSWRDHKQRILALVFSSDGQVLFSSAADQTVRAWDCKEGKEIRKLPWPEGHAMSLALSPDGRTLAAGGGLIEPWAKDRAIHLWNVATGEEIRQLAGHHEQIRCVRFSPDGKTLASASGDRTVRLWDTATGRESGRLGTYPNWVSLLAFSPDGQTVAAGLESNRLHLWNARLGKEIGLVDPPAVSSVVFSPDGAILAFVGADRKIVFWEVFSGQQVRQTAHPGSVSCFVFTSDGKRLITAGTNILVWDLAGAVRAPRVPLSEEALENLWEDMAGADAPKAYEASWRLAAAPAQALPFLKQRLKAVPPVDNKQLVQWLTDLDNDEPETRDKASYELEGLGRRAEPLLRQTLEGRPSAEVRARIKELLQKLDSLVFQGEQLRVIRAVTVLERLGSADSRQLLKILAKGEPQARLTAFAQAGLNRLEKAGKFAPSLNEQKKTAPPAAAVPPESAATIPTLPDDPFQPGALLARLGSPRWVSEDQARFVAFGPADTIVSAGREIFHWHKDTGKQLNRFGRYPRGIVAFALSRYGKILACSAHEPDIHLWDLANGKEVRQLRSGNREVWCLALSPDETMLVSAGDSKSLELWNLTEGRLIRRFGVQVSGTTSASFSPDGQSIASGGGDHLVHLWDVSTGKELREMGVYKGEGNAIAFSPDGKLLATEGLTSWIETWDAASGKPVRRIKGDPLHVRSLHFSPNGQVLAAAFTDCNTVVGWQVDTGKTVIICSHVDPLNSFAFSRGGTLLATAGIDHSVRLWDAARWREVPFVGANTAPITAVTFSPDGQTVTTAGKFSTVRRWDITSGKELPRPQQTPGWHHPVVFSPDGKVGASIREGGQVDLWYVATGKVLFPIGKPGDSIQALAFLANNKTLATASWNQVRFWDVATGKLVAKANPPTGSLITSMVFSPDGKRVVCAGVSTDLRLHHGLTFKEMERLDSRLAQFWPVIFPPNGKTLISIGEGVRIWELATLQERCFLTLHGRPVEASCLAVSPDGRTLATGGKHISLWDLATGKEIGRLLGHQVGTRCLAFSADGRRLASGSDDQACLVWDLTAVAPVAAGPSPSLTAQELEELWTELAIVDSSRAFKTLGRLVTCANPAAAFLGKKLQPVPDIAAARISELIRDLDNDEFSIREKAAEELEQFGDSVKPALRAALKNNPSDELQARIKQLLAKEPSLKLSPDHLRESRALEVLEYIGTPEAKRVLEMLTKGAPEAKLTRDAKEALERLSK